MALDPNISALLTVDVDWQAKSGLGDRGQDTHAAAVTLQCYPAYGGEQIQSREGVVYTSVATLYFDGNNAHVQTFQLGDLFTSPGIAGGQTLEAKRIEPTYSPGPALNETMGQWLVEVTL